MTKVKLVITYVTINPQENQQLIAFINKKGYLIDEFFKFIVKAGMKYNIVDFEVVTMDSTPIEAYANNFRAMSISQICYLEDFIYEYSFNHKKGSVWFNLKNYFFKGKLPDEFVDVVEEIYENLNEHGRNLLNIAVHSDKERDEILDFLDVLKEEYDGKNQVNLTDPESRKIRLKNGTKRFGYLVQTVRDAKTGFIIMQNVVKDKTDHRQLIPAIDYIIETYGRIPKYFLADNGYYCLDAIEYAHSKKIKTIIPDRNDSMLQNGTKSDDPYAKCNMPFNPLLKFFRCAFGEKLEITGTRMVNGEEKDVFKTMKCTECPLHDECTKASYRELLEPHNPHFYINKKEFLSEDGKRLYKLRAIYSEGGFGDLKETQEFKQSKRRGLSKIDIDLKLEAIANNFKKIDKNLKATFISI